jgi:NAD(P)-dependent dehydrogenase (short-subunit alcohol dehydrogenase family)
MLRVYKLDTSHATACRELCSIACKEFGRLDIVVNNAARIIRQPPHAITDEDFDAVFHHTLRGTLYMTRAAFETMKVNGGGRIVSMSSAGVHAGNVNELLYLCAKAGIETATRAFARLGANCGITLNAVAPHVIDSGMGQETISVDPTILNRIPLRRMGRIDELVSLVLYLSSKNCEYMTGQVVHLNGGRLMP